MSLDVLLIIGYQGTDESKGFLYVTTAIVLHALLQSVLKPQTISVPRHKVKHKELQVSQCLLIGSLQSFD